ncbi:DedA family protein [Shewanella sp. Scap07]|uniref:DedA family protein n=1 Tax=Shewanella sp. Scap07 TaxID=2589987 RepID=UPI0015BCD1B7|nr:DedA family protein [Shewanella sp. Scap07]QLE84497.1 DedA family protein [Shewanella sp. Scap07]
MSEMLTAIWLQDFDALLAMPSFLLLLLLLTLVLFLESSFFFLPLPGDGLVLFVGGMIGMGFIEFYPAFILLTLAAFSGTMLAYYQGYWLQDGLFMQKAQRSLPSNALPKAKKLLNKYGLLSLFFSRFVPFVRVLTPMLMGITHINPWRTLFISLISAAYWVLTLLLVGQWVIKHPLVSEYQPLLTKWLIIGSFGLMLVASCTLIVRLFKRNRHSKTV